MKIIFLNCFLSTTAILKKSTVMYFEAFRILTTLEVEVTESLNIIRRVLLHILKRVKKAFLSPFIETTFNMMKKCILSFYSKFCTVFTFLYIFYNICLVCLNFMYWVSFIFLWLIFSIKYGECLFADSILPENNNYHEKEFWKYVNASCDQSEIIRLKQIYGCSDRFFIYHYLAVYDINFHVGPWTEQDIHKASLRVNPRTLIQIVDAAITYCPEYSPDWQPPADYLSEIKFAPWMDYGPNLFFERQYIVIGVGLSILLLVLLFIGESED